MERVVCRFAVGSAGGVRSSGYRIWTAKNRPDVYIVTRSSGSLVKVTLHGARPDQGLQQEGHTRLPAAPMAGSDGQKRSTIAVRWRGQEVADGIYRQFLLYVPTRALRVFQEHDPTPMTWIEPPPDGHQTVVDVCVGRGDVQCGPSGATLFAEAPLCDGRVVRAFCLATPEPPRSEVDALLQRVVAHGARRMDAPNVRMLLLGESAGAGAFVEFAADMLDQR
jgi:hypothetical protein